MASVRPKNDEVQLRHTAIGVNYADTYHRGGVSHPWPVPDPPVVIGFEGVGIVEGVGKMSLNLRRRPCGFGIPPLGSYSEKRNYPADKLLHLPKDLDEKEVAHCMKGMTAQYLRIELIKYNWEIRYWFTRPLVVWVNSMSMGQGFRCHRNRYSFN